MASDEIWPSSDFFLRRLTFASRSGLCGGIQAQNGIFRPLKTHFSSDLRGLNCRRHQIPHPYEVIGSSREGKYPPDCCYSAMPGLPQRSNRFHPAKDFFDALSFPLAYLIACMPRRASINRATTWTLGVLSNMRCYVHSSHLTHEVFRVVGLIGSHGNALRPFYAFGHQHGRIPLRGAVALQQLRVYHQSVPVLDHDIAAICQLRFMPTTLARQARVR